MKKKNKVGGLTLPDFQTYYNATVIETVWYWYNDRQIDQCKRTESLEINPCVYGQVIFNKGGKTTQVGKESLFNK